MNASPLTPGSPLLLNRRLTRKGKIGRLPRDVRDELNRRLLERVTAPRLLKWLESLPTVCAILARDFGGRAITKQNISAWRHGAFREWRERMEATFEELMGSERTDDCLLPMHGDGAENDGGSNRIAAKVQGDQAISNPERKKMFAGVRRVAGRAVSAITDSLKNIWAARRSALPSFLTFFGNRQRVPQQSAGWRTQPIKAKVQVNPA